MVVRRLKGNNEGQAMKIALIFLGTALVVSLGIQASAGPETEGKAETCFSRKGAKLAKKGKITRT
jgi:hypothetical protein